MTCRDVFYYSIPQANPYDPNSILNPNYIPDDDCSPSFSILIYLGGTAHEFNCFYHPPTMTIEENRGFERGKATFRITDYNRTQFNLPFIPVMNLHCEIWNFTQNDLFHSGPIVEVEPIFLSRRCDGTEAMYYDITVSNKIELFERNYVYERYENVTTGFIAKDIIKRWTMLDDSDIDPTIGNIIEDFRVAKLYPSQVLQRILDLEPTWTFWVDWETEKPQIGETSQSYNTILNITESNVYSYFDNNKLILAPDNSSIHNVIIFEFNMKYGEGTCSIKKGDNIVFGQNTDFTAFVSEGSQIRINGSDSIYTIDRIYNETTLRISGNYQEDTIVTAVPFEILGGIGVVTVTDQSSIARMAALNNESGPLAGRYEFAVPNDNEYYSYQEAINIARAYLLRYSEALISGRAYSDNDKISLRSLHAGQVINFNLPTSRKVTADIVIEKLVKKDTGAKLCRIVTTPGEDRIDPLWEYDFDFKDRMFDARNQIKRLMADVRRSRVTDSNDIIYKMDFSEQLFIDDCVELVPPIEIQEGLIVDDNTQFVDPVQFSDELGIDDNVALVIPPAGPYYTTPTTSGHRDGYVIGGTKFGFVS